MAMGVFDAMPPPEPDGFNPIRCWQHSLAVARLCEQLAPESLRASAYLVGLCHDLGEVLFRTHFGAEFRQVLQAERELGLSRLDAERRMLGVTHGEMVEVILKQLALPEAMSRTIAEFHAPGESGHRLENPLASVLKLADSYAAGLLLGSSDQVSLRPLSRSACRAATGASIRHRSMAARSAQDGQLLEQYARLSPADTASLTVPPVGEKPPRLWLAQTRPIRRLTRSPPHWNRKPR